MTRRTKILMSVLGVFIVIGLSVRIATLLERRTEAVFTPPGAEARRNPLLAAHRFLEKRGIASRHLDRLDALPPPDHVLLLGAPDLALSLPLAEGLINWVLEGGHLIAAPCEGRGWEEISSTGSTLLTAFELKVDCYEADGPEASRVLTDDPEESLLVRLPWIQVTDQAESCDAEARSVVALHLERGKGRVTILGGTDVFTNRKIRDEDHARLLERLITIGGPIQGAWLVYDVGYPSLALLLWREGWPAILGAALALALLLWRSAARFGPILPVSPAGSRSLMDHIDAVGALLWRWRPSALITATRVETLRVAALRRPHLMQLGSVERSEAFAALGGVRAETARRALDGPEPTTPDEFARAMAALESIRRSL